jgi:predicted PurR-regulated permease PerM
MLGLVAFGWFNGSSARCEDCCTIMFTPMYQALLALMPRWRNVAASATVLLIAILVVFPLTMVAAGLVQEVSGVIARSSRRRARCTAIHLGAPILAAEWLMNLVTHLESTRPR